ncbi:helix-turn-helix domain-containing protein [Streptomyces verrucosisporus]|uniref:helix-turn-helix domain-containing protein n=1 Tax=Streptomyces verrucosisporus TaxID=1695161 RepID=UPI0019CF73A5|nr:helix-turn-helix transcriptional regulator [Streptomyces verrucosisporus]MBN3930381.1 helix-turn-helix domain-containing protein [Streptomyces verrucosisporus]
MPPRENPTARQVRLGVELRKLRERAGKPAREAGGLLGVDQAKISNIESGRIGVSEERIRRLAAFYSCVDAALIDALCAMARERRGQFWWDEYRGVLPPPFLDIAELEHHSVAMCSMQTFSVPGLLQTEDYARTLFDGAVPRLPEEEVEARVEHRMRRRTVLEREDSPAYETTIHEAVLHMRFGGRKVVRAQLEHLAEMSTWPGVTVRVVPFACEEFIEITQPLLYAVGVVPQLDTVQMDSPLGSVHLDAETELQKYQALLGIAKRASLDEDESRRLIRRIAREL